ncbi:V-type ATP synthase subunit I [Desulfopila inferna]|uniref:V-type ATP synthase subunit I n=1 Tax=Desulfopila inferna TaxID=468528 RepID=UPI00196307BD|nr:V-type ATPase 116kDa subunit family protein [Desulfopila inferna]MBM9604173.1 hypothetical protein [Desulfopila inferna]
MIVKMSKVFIATRIADRDRILNLLGKMNIMHLEPVHPEDTLADESTIKSFNDLSLAVQILSSFKPSGAAFFQNPVAAAREAIGLHRSISENRHRLLELHQRIRELEIWGNVSLSQLADLLNNGVEVEFYTLSRKKADNIRAECVEILSTLPGEKLLVAIVDRRGQLKMPEEAEALPFPSRDRPSCLAEAQKIEIELQQSYDRLSQLAALAVAMRKEQTRLAGEITYVKAQRSGMSQGKIFALQGWLPAEKADTIESHLAGSNLYAAVRIMPVGADDMPPTLIHYPSWTKPIKGFFDILGILPGYREIDLSPSFMLAMPVFTAMLIGDAGYGLLIFLAGLFFRNRIVHAAGKSATQLMMVFGLATLTWGILTANYFGITPETLWKAGEYGQFPGTDVPVDHKAFWQSSGICSLIAGIMSEVGILWREDPSAARFIVMKVSLVVGCLHLFLARLRRMVALFPDQRALAEIGWLIIIADMLVVTWYLLFIGVEHTPMAVWLFLGGGMFIAACFGKPDKNPAKRFLVGVFSAILPLLNTFTDTMSYLRLFAVGLSSYYISSAFNAMGLQIAEAATWFAAVPILILGHGLNIALVTIAIFAHGIRLNILEFSNHAGVQWDGYPYRPFAINQRSAFGEDIQ